MIFKDFIFLIYYIRGFDMLISFVIVFFIFDIILLFMYNLLL